MTNHPNRKLTPLRKAFLTAALADDGRVLKGTYVYRAGEMCIKSHMGEVLCEMGLIERVKETGSNNTARWRTGLLYRVTEAGHAALS